MSTNTKVSWIAAFRPLLLIAIMSTALMIIFREKLANWNMNTDVLIWGNLILFIATISSFYFFYRSLAKRSLAFLNMVYMGLFVKLGLCLMASFLYIYLAGKSVNKPAILALMGLYLVYTFIELMIITRLGREQQNG